MYGIFDFRAQFLSKYGRNENYKKPDQTSKSLQKFVKFMLMTSSRYPKVIFGGHMKFSNIEIIIFLMVIFLQTNAGHGTLQSV